MSLVTGMATLGGMNAELYAAEVIAKFPKWTLQQQLAEVMRRSKGSVNPAYVRELLGRPHLCSKCRDPRENPWWSTESRSDAQADTTHDGTRP